MWRNRLQHRRYIKPNFRDGGGIFVAEIYGVSLNNQQCIKTYKTQSKCVNSYGLNEFLWL